MTLGEASFNSACRLEQSSLPALSSRDKVVARRTRNAILIFAFLWCSVEPMLRDCFVVLPECSTLSLSQQLLECQSAAIMAQVAQQISRRNCPVSWVLLSGHFFKCNRFPIFFTAVPMSRQWFAVTPRGVAHVCWRRYAHECDSFKWTQSRCLRYADTKLRTGGMVDDLIKTSYRNSFLPVLTSSGSSAKTAQSNRLMVESVWFIKCVVVRQGR